MMNDIRPSVGETRSGDEQERRWLETENLRLATAALTSTLDLNTVLDTILTRLAQVINYDSIGVFLLENDRLVMKASRGLPIGQDLVGHQFPSNDALFQRIRHTGKPLIIPDVQLEPAFQRWADTDYVKGWMGVPLILQDQVIGYITCDSHIPDTYTSTDASLAAAFANQAAIAIQNARLYEAERAAHEQAEILRELAQTISSSLDLHVTLRLILEQLQRVLVFDTCSVLLVGENKPDLIVGLGYKDENFTSQAAGELLQESRILQSMAQTLQPVNIPDVRQHPDWIWVPGAEHVRSFLCIPITERHKMTGAIMVDSIEIDFFGPGQIKMVQALAQHMAVAIQNARLFEAERAQLLLARTLQEMGALLTSELSLEEVLEKILDLLGRVIQYDSASIHLLDERGRLRLAAGRGFPDIETTRKTIAETDQIDYHQWMPQKALVISDTRQYPKWKTIPSTDYIRSWIGAPLSVKGRLIGSLNVDSRTPNTYQKADGETALAFANQAAIAIENARLFAIERLRIAELEAVHQASLSLTASLELSQVLNSILESTLKLLPEIRDSHIFLYDAQDDQLSFGAALWADGQRGTPWSLPRRQGLTYAVAHSGEMVVIPDMQNHPLYQNTYSGWQGAIVGLPLKIGQQVVGVMNVAFLEPHQFLDSELRLLRLLGDQAAIAIENARLFEQASIERRHLGLLYDINREISGSLSPDEILTTAVTLTCQALQGLWAEGFIYHPDQNHISLRVIFDSRKPGREDSLPYDHLFLEPGQGVVGWTAQERAIACIPDVRQDARWFYIPSLDEGVVSVLSAPILAADQLLGVIIVSSQEPAAFSTEHVHLIQAICQEIGLALSNAALYDQVRQHALNLEQIITQRTAELTELYRLSQEISYQFSFDDLLLLLLSRLHSALSGEFVAGCLIPANQPHIFVETDRPLEPAVLDELKSIIQMSTTPNQADELTQKQIKVINSARYAARQEPVRQIASLLTEPILVEQNNVGILIAGSTRKEAFSPEQARLLGTFANQAATAMQGLEAMLSAQQKQFSNLVEHLPVGVLLLDSDFVPLVANPLGAELLSILDEHLSQGAPVQRLGSHAIQEMAAAEETQRSFEITLENLPRRIFVIQMRPIFTTAGNRQQWVLTINEVTQEREQQERSQGQERLATVGQLAAGIAHDFNNIMATILVYANLLNYDRSLSPNSHEKLNVIQQQVERASSLIHQILDFSRKSVLEPNNIDLLPFVKEMEKMLKRILPETIQLELSFQPGNYWISGDLTRLQQVFMNLALNARDAMPTGGRLRFALSHLHFSPDDPAPMEDMLPGNWVHIAISDTGAGIPQETREHIFEPFFTTKPVGQGTGLGLAQVYGIVKTHEGFIDVHSQLGRGATFDIYLPALTSFHANPDFTPPVEKLDGCGQSILVVEDDPSTRQALRALLEMNNYQVLLAENGVQALDIFDEQSDSIILVISDIIMPKMGGLALHREIKKRSPEIKILLITGHPMDEQSQHLLQQGDIRWLQKPFSIKDFNQALALLLSTPTSK